MNILEYKVIYAKIEHSKYIKDIEALLRTYCTSNWSYTDVDDSNHTEKLFTYSLASFALHRFKEKSKASLPDFIEIKINNLSKNLLMYYFEHSRYPMTYKEYVTYFKYYNVTSNDFPTNSGMLISNITNIVQANYDPISISNYNVQSILSYEVAENITNSKYRTRYLLKSISNTNLGRILTLEDLLYHLPLKDKSKYVLLNQALEYYYSFQTQADLDKVNYFGKSLIRLVKTVKEKHNGTITKPNSDNQQ